MLHTLTLFLVAQVCSEWVEISQHHYRKPIRTRSHFTTPDRAVQVEDTTKPWLYNNRSMTEYTWNKNTANTNIGYVKRVQLFESTTRNTEKVVYENPDLDEDTDYEFRPNYGSTKPTIEFNEDKHQKGIVKVPNLGNIERVQLNNSPVKSPAIHFKGDEEKIPKNRYKSTAQEYATTENYQKYEKNNRRVYINQVNQRVTEKTNTFPPDDEDSSHFNKQVTTYDMKELTQAYNNHSAVEKTVHLTEPTFITEDFVTQRNPFHKIHISKSPEVADKINILTTDSPDIQEEVSIQKNKQPSKLTTEELTTRPDLDKVNIIKDFETESSENNVQHSANDKITSLRTNDPNTNTKANVASDPKQETLSENHHGLEDKDKQEHTSKETKTKGKVKTLENVMKFMRVVADTISRNSRRSFGGKLQYLHELKDSILANIEERIDATWPDDESAGGRRHSRSAHASPRGHVQFPSSESALMTISFLTFAVFLIKLVLQVIQTYKHKAMMVAPVVVASSGRNVFTQRDHGQH